jgi:hypothetical protein
MVAEMSAPPGCLRCECGRCHGDMKYERKTLAVVCGVCDHENMTIAKLYL